MTQELVTNGLRMTMIARRKTAPIQQGLGPNQLQYLIDKGWIDRRRVVPLEKKS